ncbi:MAG: hypothetical protein IKV79_04235 [Oscillospiraceae bacterium]|nr:hypothetical protein [Oscillospiraceae bacterium]
MKRFLIVILLPLSLCLLSGCGKLPADADFNSDSEAREQMLKKVIRVLRSDMDFGGRDEAILSGGNGSWDDSTRTVLSLDIKSRKGAKLLFGCVENCCAIKDITDLSPEESYLPIKSGAHELCTFKCLHIQIPDNGRSYCIEFSDEDSKSLYEYAHSLGLNSLPQSEDAATRATADFLEDVIRHLDQRIDYSGSDIIAAYKSGDEISLSALEIHEKETAELLFECIRSADAVYDITNATAPIDYRYFPVFANSYEQICSFESVIFPSPASGRIIYIAFRSEDSRALCDYLLSEAEKSPPGKVGGLYSTITELKPVVFSDSEELKAYLRENAPEGFSEFYVPDPSAFPSYSLLRIEVLGDNVSFLYMPADDVDSDWDERIGISVHFCLGDETELEDIESHRGLFIHPSGHVSSGYIYDEATGELFFVKGESLITVHVPGEINDYLDLKNIFSMKKISLE